MAKTLQRLAQEFSQDTGSAVNGGDLGWFGTGAMVPEFETAAFALEKTGDYTTTPVQSQFGYHIIQLIAKQERPLSADQYETAKSQSLLRLADRRPRGIRRGNL